MQLGSVFGSTSQPTPSQHKGWRSSPPGQFKHPYCYVRADGEWIKYPVSALYDEQKRLYLDRAQKYEHPGFDARKLINSRRGDTWFWRLASNGATEITDIDCRANASECHTAMIAHYLALLPKLHRFETLVFNNDSSIRGSLPRRSLQGFTWEAEQPLKEFGIQPDIVGSSLCPNWLSNVFAKKEKISERQPTFRYLCIEIIDKGPPTAEKLKRLLNFSRTTGAIIVFGVVTNADPNEHTAQFKANAKDRRLLASHYIMTGHVYVNTKRARWLENAEVLQKELRHIQFKSGYIGI